MGFIYPISKLFQKTSFSWSMKKINHTKYLAVLFSLSLSDSTKMPYINVENKFCFQSISREKPFF